MRPAHKMHTIARRDDLRAARVFRKGVHVSAGRDIPDADWPRLIARHEQLAGRAKLYVRKQRGQLPNALPRIHVEDYGLADHFSFGTETVHDPAHGYGFIEARDEFFAIRRQGK